MQSITRPEDVNMLSTLIALHTAFWIMLSDSSVRKRKHSSLICKELRVSQVAWFTSLLDHRSGCRTRDKMSSGDLLTIVHAVIWSSLLLSNWYAPNHPNNIKVHFSFNCARCSYSSFHSRSVTFLSLTLWKSWQRYMIWTNDHYFM